MAKGCADLQYCSKMENRPIWRKRILGNFNFGQKKMSKIVLRRIESKSGWRAALEIRFST